MSIFAKFGAPDLFITFTANHNCPEITENLRPGERTSDRTDLVARVFTIKLKTLMDDLIVRGVFGEATAFVYTIELQTRGLPHTHILATLRAEDKFTTGERIDQFVSVEIPAEAENSHLHEIVTRCMTHRPHGNNNRYTPCMEDGKCKK